MPERYQHSLNLRRSNLSGASLVGADLSGADLSQANLSRAVLVKANLSGAELTQADLSGATLSGANLSGANLEDTYLHGAILTAIDVTGYDLELLRRSLGLGQQEVGSMMSIDGTDLTTAIGLDLKDHLEWAIGDSTTKEPHGTARPEAWSNTTLASDEYEENLSKQFKRIEKRLMQYSKQ
jgi:uncharacterized protein YjbI with pentapeptide repeats